MNDWFLATNEVDSNSCYNLFQFYTGGGEEYWEIRVYHSTKKGIKVIRNNVDVTDDTNIVKNGKYGFSSSLLKEESHTLYEFAIKVKPGAFFFPTLCDPVRNVGPQLICEENGYGLIQEPYLYGGELNKNGSNLRKHVRYIPLSGIHGMVTEPNIFTGYFVKDTSFIRIPGNDGKINVCNKSHTIDGKFTKIDENNTEWQHCNPAIGKYSNLYAEYCNGKLYILNDWILGTHEPDERNCYNLFELFTGGGKEHWGIFVYHNIEKGIKVFLNGKDVSNDTNYVEAGKFGFDISPLKQDSAHTIYEFSIKASEGDWHLFLCDPSPSSFCDDNPNLPPRLFDNNLGIREYDKLNPGNPGDHHPIINIQNGKSVSLGFGTSVDTKNWYCRKYKVVINYNKNNFLPNLLKNLFSFPLLKNMIA